MLPGEAPRRRARSSLMAPLSSPTARLSPAPPPFPATPAPPAQAAASSAARPGGGARGGGCLRPAQPHAAAAGRLRGSGAGAPRTARPPRAGSQPLRRPLSCPGASAVRRERTAVRSRTSPASDRYAGVTPGGGCPCLPGEELRGGRP